MLKCSASCTNQRLQRRSAPWHPPPPPNRVFGVALPTLLRKSDFLPAPTELPCRSSALVSRRLCVTTFIGSAASSSLPAPSAETLTTRSCTCSPIPLSPWTCWRWICGTGLASPQFSSLLSFFHLPHLVLLRRIGRHKSTTTWGNQ